MSNDPLPSRLELKKRFEERVKQSNTTTTRPTLATFNQLPSYLQQVLPDNYTYIIKTYKEFEIEPDRAPGCPTAAFDSTFYVNISSSEAIEEWRGAFHNKTGTVFRITRADKVKGIKVIYHKDFHCRHADIAAIKYMQKTYAQKVGQRRSRNTNCQCLAKIRLEKARLQLSHPCEIHLVYNHNHPLEVFPNQQISSGTSSMLSSPTPQQQKVHHHHHHHHYHHMSPQIQTPPSPPIGTPSELSESFSGPSSPQYIAEFATPPSPLMLSSNFMSQDHCHQQNHLSVPTLHSPPQQPHDHNIDHQPRRQASSSSLISSDSSYSVHSNNATTSNLLDSSDVLQDFNQFVKETEVDIVNGDEDFCRGLTKFIKSHRKARQVSISHAAQFLNQFEWQDLTNQDVFAAATVYALNTANAVPIYHHDTTEEGMGRPPQYHHETQFVGDYHSHPVVSDHQNQPTIHLLNEHQRYQQHTTAATAYEHQYQQLLGDRINSRKRDVDQISTEEDAVIHKKQQRIGNMVSTIGYE